MLLTFRNELGVSYKSASQRARILTEDWALRNMYCPACVSNRLRSTKNNTEAVDFQCIGCDAEYQLKATSKPIGRKIVDAGYDAMMRAIREDRLPHFLFLSYDNILARVNDLMMVPSFCLSASAIEARKPLGANARRAGWVGCNIILDSVPTDGRIRVVQHGRVFGKEVVRRSFHEVEALRELSVKSRGWTLDVLTLLQSLKKDAFTLKKVYSFEKTLSEMHPENRNVKPKIRQQLQVLRDLGYIDFLGRGFYKWKK